MHIQPYLFFEGRCEEAFEFYRTALGAKLERKVYFKDSPDPNMPPPAHPDKVMHMSFQVGETTIFASDGRAEHQPEFKGFALSVMADDVAEAEKKFNALAVGGKIQMPLAKTFFSPIFGMLSDKFGILWMVLVKQ